MTVSHHFRVSKSLGYLSSISPILSLACGGVHSLDTPHVEIRLLDDSASDAPLMFALTSFEKSGPGALEYVRGVAWALHEDGLLLKGWRGVMQGDVPIGAGLSSSAALELAVARAFAAVSGFDWDPVRIAQLCQKAENAWVGVNTGIMDQLISATGQAGKAMLIDCRSLELYPTPLPPETALVVLDTNTRRGLVTSKYGERREQCEAAARFFGVPALRDVNVAQFNERAHELDDVIRRRTRHVITENDRTVKAAEAMRKGDATTLGRLMNESHTSMRDDFENSTELMDAMVVIAQAHDACYSARITAAASAVGRWRWYEPIALTRLWKWSHPGTKRTRALIQFCTSAIRRTVHHCSIREYT